MPHPATKNSERKRLLQKALARWENEGGQKTDRLEVDRESPGEAGRAGEVPGGVPPLTNAELVQLQIRVIALEHMVVALMADASEEQLARVRDIAASIFPRPGVEHRLTVHASAQMGHLAQRSQRL